MGYRGLSRSTLDLHHGYKMNGDVWLSGSAPDLCNRGSGLDSGISHNDPDALDHCGRGKPTPKLNEKNMLKNGFLFTEIKMIFVKDRMYGASFMPRIL